MRRVEVWSDIHCPWALVAVHRLRQARARLGAEAAFVPRAWPLEWVNGRGTPFDIVSVEVATLASHEPDLFNRYRGSSWPSTFLPAFELVAAAGRVGGAVLAEHVDYALRIAFFRDSVDVSIEAGLRQSLDLSREYYPGCDADAVISAWQTLGVRSDVIRDFRESQDVAIQGSPQIIFPDGTSAHNPGMTDHYWRGGLVRINSTDPGEPGRLLSNSIAGPAMGHPPCDGANARS